MFVVFCACSAVLGAWLFFIGRGQPFDWFFGGMFLLAGTFGVLTNLKGSPSPERDTPRSAHSSEALRDIQREHKRAVDQALRDHRAEIKRLTKQ